MKFDKNFALLMGLLVATSCVLATQKGVAATEKVFYVSSSGNDKNAGTQSEPFQTLGRARDAVRQINQEMSGDIEVVLCGGTYRLAEALVLDHRDSGTNGHNVIYKSAEGENPVLSGGRPVTGWMPDTDGRWKAACGEHFRQLYVDGKRAMRARSPETKTEKPTKRFQLGIAYVPGMELFGEDAYRTTDVAMVDWRNPGDVEFCYYVGWCHTRCKVDSIVRDGDHAVIRMVQPQFMLARCKEGLRANLPNYLENAMELLDQPGEWYLDRSAKMLYYRPRSDEDMKTVEVIVPVLEKLIELRGLLDKRVEHIQFRELTFTHATWLEPNRTGLVEQQANFRQHMLNKMERMGYVCNAHNEVLKSPANVVCRMAKNIRFDGCTFTQLGGAGIDLEYGSQGNVIANCHFNDISGTAIQVGDVQRSDHHPGDKRTVVKNNRVVDNLIENCAIEYMGGVGVFVGYTDATQIARNEIRNLPYSGISVGWGWGEEDAGGGSESYYLPYRYKTPSTSQNNRIELNHIHHVLQKLDDGGGIYTLGNMPGAVIRWNHIHDNTHYPGGIYLDEGSGFFEVTENLVYDVERAMNFNNRAQNRIDTCKVHDNFFNVCPESSDQTQKPGAQPTEKSEETTAAIRRIMDNVGPREQEAAGQ